MNRFRTKKKAKESTEGLGRASTDFEVPVAPVTAIKHSKTFRRNKKTPEPQPKLELDLSSALPSSDDFRTSLLMSGLSARFSMLREQDDPKSKIGKASDDSVLFPKRQSRLNDFGFAAHGLSDIAEVSSINGSIRRPFAFSRTDSYTDGYGTDDDSTYGGSIMNRAKPGEGNNLFGGRQKIYKIPVNAAGSSRSLTEGGGMGGRALYENDVSQSAFQKLRDREREEIRLQKEREQEESNAESSRAESPPFSGYNRNRETSSTTSSAGLSITRSSTAATSFTSQRTPSLSGSHTPVTTGALPGAPGLERTTMKGRRLYETGLDQHLHEQQHSAMNRIDTITRQRTLGAQTPPPGLSSPTTTYPVDRWDRQQVSGKASASNMRAASPPPNASALGSFDFGMRSQDVVETKTSFGLVSPPLSPPISETEDQGILAVQPNDRGKATALGTFSKPVQLYDESKYTQRQLQMQQGKEIPSLRQNSPTRAFVPKQQQQMERMRANSNVTFASSRSRSNSSAHSHFPPQDRSPDVASKTSATTPENENLNSGTFLSSSNASSLGSREDVDQVIKPKQPFIFPSQIYRQNQQQSGERPPESQHPANRPRPLQPNALFSKNAVPSAPLPSSNNFSRISDSAEPATASPSDSPTLGPTTGLSGMVRQHLRSDSNTSSIYGASIYGAPSAGLVSHFPHDPNEPLPQIDYTSKGNPWDIDDWDRTSYEENTYNSASMVDRTQGNHVLPPPLSVRSANVDAAIQEPMKSPWEKELETHHTRDGSSETQKERQDFQAELATRRRRVQENLKSFQETESGSTSPALNNLKSKSSRSSLVGKPREAGQSKAMKMLGIASSNSPGKSSSDENVRTDEADGNFQGIPKGSTIAPQTKAFRQARRDAQRDRERQLALRHQQKISADAHGTGAERPAHRFEDSSHRNAAFRDRVPPNIRTGRRTPSRERGHPPMTQSSRNGNSQESKRSLVASRSTSRPPSRASRDRSSSNESGRSKSRTGRFKDDLAKAMAEGIGSSGQGTYDDTGPSSARLVVKSPVESNLAMQPSHISPPMIGSTAARNLGNSKPTSAAYSESHNLHPIQTSEGMESGLSPRPSPITPYSVNSTPALTQPSPGGSGASTPIISQGFAGQVRTPGGRKRSINKAEISEPRFVSSTSRVPTVDLPPGTTLQKGVDAPPIPPVNPRRRQTRAIFGFGKKDDSEEMHFLPAASQSTEEMSTFSADEGDTKSKVRQKLRKTSSEGGNLNARARQAAIAGPSPALPNGGFQGEGSPPRPHEGGMF